MKKIFLSALALFVMISVVFGQKKLTEATIYYDIVINTNSSTPGAADLMDGATNIVYLKGNSSRADMISSLGTQSTIIDGKTNGATILKEYGDQKYMITLTPADWKNYNKKYDGVTYTIENEFKKIAGYNCQKAVGKLSDGTTFTVYFTKDLVPVNNEFQYINKNLPGLAMQYEAAQGKAKVTYTVSNIDFSIVPLAKFDLPKSGYRVMTYAESTQGKQ
jgi:GLPGLI family protein